MLALDMGRPLTGSGTTALQQALVDVLSGTTVHGGALLAGLGVRFVVFDEASVPAAALSAFASQVDLELVPAAGLTIWRNVAALPPAGVVAADDEASAIVASDNPDVIQRWEPVPSAALSADDAGGTGSAEGGNLAIVATEFDDAWELSRSTSRPPPPLGRG